ncbi:MAG: MarR family transcriptional regulator [Prolixibacteraceae bacterium]|nr:MarR family transcriptional regulator [Prolixibacteraceae bacterium]
MYDYTSMEGYLVTKASVFLKRKLVSVFKKNGYETTFEQWIILNALAKEDGLIQSEIAIRTFKDKANITRILDNMERDGLVHRAIVKNNRRNYCIFLTEKGNKLFLELRKYAIENNDNILSVLTEEERNVLKVMLNKIIKSIY